MKISLKDSRSHLSTAALSLTALLALPSIGSAATVSFFTPVTSLSDTSTLDTAFSFQDAALVQAVNFGSGTGSGAQSVNTGSQTINFTAGATSVNDISGTATTLFNTGTQGGVLLSPTTTGNTQFDNVLMSDGWHNQATDATRPLVLQIGGLTAGTNYVITLLSADGRAGSADRTQQYFDSFDSGTGIFSGGSSDSFSENTNTSVVGTFLADATTQTIYIKATDLVGNADTTLSGFTLYSYTVVPEPGTYAMLAGLAALSFVALRRRSSKA